MLTYSFAVLCDSKATISKLISELPQLRHIKIRWHSRLDIHRRPATLRPLLNILADNYLPTSDIGSIIIETEILARGALYMPYPARRDRSLVVAYGQNNWVEYRGVTSDDSNAYRGIDWEVVRCSRFMDCDLQKAQAKVKNVVTLRRRSSLLQRLARYTGGRSAEDPEDQDETLGGVHVAPVSSDLFEEEPFYCKRGRNARELSLLAESSDIERCLLHLHRNDDTDSEED